MHLTTNRPPKEPTPTQEPANPPADIKPENPAGALRVASLGDSLTLGDGDDSGLGGYPSRLQALVEAAHPGSRSAQPGPLRLDQAPI